MSDKKKICTIIEIILLSISVILAIVSFFVKGFEFAFSIPALTLVVVSIIIHYVSGKEKVYESREKQLSFDFDELNEEQEEKNNSD